MRTISTLNHALSSQHVIDFTERQRELRRMKKVKSITELKRLQRGADHPKTLAARKRCNFCNSFNFLTVLGVRNWTSTLAKHS
jgi:hypothetical protein